MEEAEATEIDLTALVDWVREVTGATDVHAERRSAGASRAGYAVDATTPDGRTLELWLRVDTGVGPQSHTKYTVRREASVYAALRDTAVGVPRLVAVHPTIEAFLAERLPGRNWFAEIRDPAHQERIAIDYMQRLAALHALDPASLDVPALGAPTTVRDHVHEELDEWDAQLAQHDDPDPCITWPMRWLRANVPDDDGWPVVLVHGDAGPGNFLYEDDDDPRVVAVMDWEMAHWGDRHDDLGWVYVRDVQERLSSLPDRMRDYEAASGRAIDPTRFHYFRVLAQARCAIGTRNGLLARDSRGEIANHLIYSTLHQRLLVEAMADALGAPLPASPPLAAADASRAWMYDVALDDLRDTVVPAITDGFASRRAKGLARLLKFLRAQHVLGAADQAAERDDLRAVLGRVGDRAALCEALRSGEVDDERALWWCARAAARATQIAAPAMGALATRHYAGLPFS